MYINDVLHFIVFTVWQKQTTLLKKNAVILKITFFSYKFCPSEYLFIWMEPGPK